MRGCKFHNSLVEWKLYDEALTSWHFWGSGRLGLVFTNKITHFEMNYRVYFNEFEKGDGFNLSNKKEYNHNCIYKV